MGTSTMLLLVPVASIEINPDKEVAVPCIIGDRSSSDVVVRIRTQEGRDDWLSLVVLTAHPTQINRRTLQYKHIRIAHLLEYNDRPDLSHEDREMLIEDLHTGRPLPMTATLIKFGSWMGGDRDGNPNVTSKVTKDVTRLSRWMATDLYIREVDSLRFELSMNKCSNELSRYVQKGLGCQQSVADATDEEAKKKARQDRFTSSKTSPKMDSVEEDKNKARTIRFSECPVVAAPSQTTNGKGNSTEVCFLV